MSIRTVLLPLFVQVLLTFTLATWSGYLRVQAVRGGAVKARDVALREPNWPPHVLKVQYAFQNQLELPLLFYLLTILAWLTKQVDLVFVVMAWLFVGLRLLHAVVHVGSNHLGRRAILFIAGATVLAAMWLIYMVRIALA